jgi:hypothetical protein
LQRRRILHCAATLLLPFKKQQQVSEEVEEDLSSQVELGGRRRIWQALNSLTQSLNFNVDQLEELQQQLLESPCHSSRSTFQNFRGS